MNDPLSNLKTIVALCDNPHWTTDRRWRIRDLAAQALRDLEFKQKTGDFVEREEGPSVDD